MTCDPARSTSRRSSAPIFGIEVTVDPTVPDGTVLSNTATVTSDADDGNPGNNTSTAARAGAGRGQPARREAGRSRWTPTGTHRIRRSRPRGRRSARRAARPRRELLRSRSPTTDRRRPPTCSSSTRFPLDAAYFPVGDCEFLNRETRLPLHATRRPATCCCPARRSASRSSRSRSATHPQGVYTNTARATTSTEETTLADNVDTRADRDHRPGRRPDHRQDGGDVAARRRRDVHLPDRRVGRPASTSPTPVLRLSSDAEDVVVTDTLPDWSRPGVGDLVAGRRARSPARTSAASSAPSSRRSRSIPVPPTLVTITGTVAPDAQPNAGDDVDEHGRGDVVDRAARRRRQRLVDRDHAAHAQRRPRRHQGRRRHIGRRRRRRSRSPSRSPTPARPTPPASCSPTCSPPRSCSRRPAPTPRARSSPATSCARSAPSPPGRRARSRSPPRCHPSAAAGSVTNTASVTSDVDDPDGTDNAASVDVDVVQAADLSVTKTAAAEGVLLGGTIAYTLTVVNEGPSDADRRRAHRVDPGRHDRRHAAGRMHRRRSRHDHLRPRRPRRRRHRRPSTSCSPCPTRSRPVRSPTRRR